MAYEHRLIAAMGNPHAAKAWRKACYLADLAARRSLSVEYWEGKYVDESDACIKAIKEQHKLRAELDAAQRAIVTLQADNDRLFEEREAYYAEAEYWLAIATNLVRRKDPAPKVFLFVVGAALNIGAWAFLLSRVH